MDNFHEDNNHEQPAMDYEPEAVEEDAVEEQAAAPKKRERRAPDAAVDAVLSATRAHILADDGSHIVRKPIPVSQQDRKKVRRRNVDTDVSVSDLVSHAVVDLLKEDGAEIEASNRKRPAILTIAAPEWWWSLLKLRADASGAQISDVVAVAIADHLP